jgi:dUTP pyrophosphatase
LRFSMVTQTLQMPKLEIFRLDHGPHELPRYETRGSAGMDIRVAIDAPITLASLERVLVPTGLIFHIPQGYEVQLRARSGLSIKYGVTLINGIGTIDSDYRHEVKVALVNLSHEPYTIQPGERVCQMVLSPVVQAHLEWIEETAVLESRQGGFGSTGHH